MKESDRKGMIGTIMYEVPTMEREVLEKVPIEQLTSMFMNVILCSIFYKRPKEVSK